MRAYKQWQRRGGVRGNLGRGAGRRYGDRQAGKNRQPSIQVRADWKILEELDFQRLGKLLLPNVEPGVDMYVIFRIMIFIPKFLWLSSKSMGQGY